MDSRAYAQQQQQQQRNTHYRQPQQQQRHGATASQRYASPHHTQRAPPGTFHPNQGGFGYPNGGGHRPSGGGGGDDDVKKYRRGKRNCPAQESEIEERDVSEFDAIPGSRADIDARLFRVIANPLKVDYDHQHKPKGKVPMPALAYSRGEIRYLDAEPEPIPIAPDPLSSVPDAQPSTAQDGNAPDPGKGGFMDQVGMPAEQQQEQQQQQQQQQEGGGYDAYGATNGYAPTDGATYDTFGRGGYGSGDPYAHQGQAPHGDFQPTGYAHPSGDQGYYGAQAPAEGAYGPTGGYGPAEPYHYGEQPWHGEWGPPEDAPSAFLMAVGEGAHSEPGPPAGQSYEAGGGDVFHIDDLGAHPAPSNEAPLYDYPQSGHQEAYGYDANASSDQHGAPPPMPYEQSYAPTQWGDMEDAHTGDIPVYPDENVGRAGDDYGAMPAQQQQHQSPHMGGAHPQSPRTGAAPAPEAAYRQDDDNWGQQQQQQQQSRAPQPPTPEMLEEIEREKRLYKQTVLLSLQGLEKKGIKLTREFTMNDHVSEMEYEFDYQQYNRANAQNIQAVRDKINFARAAVLFGNRIVGSFFKKPDGLVPSKQLIEEYDDTIKKNDYLVEVLARKYYGPHAGSVASSPEIGLGIALITALGGSLASKAFMGNMRTGPSSKSSTKSKQKAKAPAEANGDATWNDIQKTFHKGGASSGGMPFDPYGASAAGMMPMMHYPYYNPYGHPGYPPVPYGYPPYGHPPQYGGGGGGSGGPPPHPPPHSPYQTGGYYGAAYPPTMASPAMPDASGAMPPPMYDPSLPSSPSQPFYAPHQEAYAPHETPMWNGPVQQPPPPHHPYQGQGTFPHGVPQNAAHQYPYHPAMQPTAAPTQQPQQMATPHVNMAAAVAQSTPSLPPVGQPGTPAMPAPVQDQQPVAQAPPSAPPKRMMGRIAKPK